MILLYSIHNLFTSITQSHLFCVTPYGKSHRIKSIDLSGILLTVNASSQKTLTESLFCNCFFSFNKEIYRLVKVDMYRCAYLVKETDENLRVATLDARQKQIANQSNNGQVPQSVNVQNNTYNFTSNEMLNMLKQLNLTKEVTNVEDLPKFDLH